MKRLILSSLVAIGCTGTLTTGPGPSGPPPAAPPPSAPPPAAGEPPPAAPPPVAEGGFRREHYDRYDEHHWRGRWVQISGAYTATKATQEVDMMGAGGHFNMVRIEGVSGDPTIGRVTIQFMNDQSQVVDLNVRLMPGQGEVIDLTGSNRKIKRVMVYPTAGSRGSYAIYGL